MNYKSNEENSGLEFFTSFDTPMLVETVLSKDNFIFSGLKIIRFSLTFMFIDSANLLPIIISFSLWNFDCDWENLSNWNISLRAWSVTPYIIIPSVFAPFLMIACFSR